MTDYKQLTEAQRYQIAALLRAGQTNKKIAEIIGVSEGTVSRELTRNRGLRGYRPNPTSSPNNEVPRHFNQLKILTTVGWHYGFFAV
ncbi:MAG: hypothetical protein CVV13_06975, partial [Gammaproteobacteria bacterium HGW-Gammaproteobacteria-3]